MRRTLLPFGLGVGLLACGGAETPATEVTDVAVPTPTASAPTAEASAETAPTVTARTIPSPSDTPSSSSGLTGYAGFVDAYCACEGDMKCISDAGVRFADSMRDAATTATVDLAKKLADCVTEHPVKTK